MAFFDTVIGNIDENEEARSRDLNFLTILSYLHTTALDLRLLIDCDPHGITDFGMAVYLNPFHVQNAIRSPLLVCNAIRKARRQLQDILPEPCSAAQLANKAARYANKSLLQLQRGEENQMMITIPDIFQDLLRSKAFKQNLSGEREFFTLSIVLAREIGRKLDWQQPTLGDNFASVVSSLMRFAHLATKSWEHFWIAELNYWAAKHAYDRMRTEQACKHYEWAEEHWSHSHQLRTSREIYWVMGYGRALAEEGDYDKAEMQFRKASRWLRIIEGKFSSNTIHAKVMMLRVAQMRGYEKQADDVYIRRTLLSYDAPYRTHKITHGDWSGINMYLGYNLQNQNRYHEAMEVYLISITKMLDEYNGLDTRVQSTIYNTLCTAYRVKLYLEGYHKGAELLTSVIEGTATIRSLASILNIPVNNHLKEPVRRQTSARTRFASQVTLAMYLAQQGRMEAAETSLLDIPRDGLGRYVTLSLQGFIALIRIFRNDFEQAERDFIWLCEQFRKIYTSRGWWPRTALRVHEGLAFVKGMQNKPGATEEYLSVIELSRKHLGKDHPKLFIMYYNFATVLKHQGDVRGASEWFAKAASGTSRVVGPEHTDTFHSINALNALPTRLGLYTEQMLEFRSKMNL